MTRENTIRCDQGHEQKTPHYKYKLEIGEWGHLPQELCRRCHQVGNVYFDASDGPNSRMGHETVRCELCGYVWYPGESSA